MYLLLFTDSWITVLNTRTQAFRRILAKILKILAKIQKILARIRNCVV